MTPAEELAARREGRAAVEATLEEELAASQRRAEVAEADHAAKKSDWTALIADATRDFREGERMAAGQWTWLHGEMREPLRLAENERGAARAKVKSLQEQLAEIRRENAQADRQLTAGKIVELPRSAVAPARRKVVDYDDIEMPREAAQ